MHYIGPYTFVVYVGLYVGVDLCMHLCICMHTFIVCMHLRVCMRGCVSLNMAGHLHGDDEDDEVESPAEDESDEVLSSRWPTEADE